MLSARPHVVSDVGEATASTCMMAHALTATRMHTRTPFLFLPLSLSPSLHRGRHSGRYGERLQRPLRSRCHCPWIAPGFHCRCFPLLRAWSHAPVRVRQATLELRAVNPSLLADGPALPAKDHFFGWQSTRDRPCHQQPVARRLYGPRSAPRCAPRPLSLPRAGEDSGGMASK